MPLISYSIHNSKDVNARVDSLNIFGQNLPTLEVIKELQGASYRTFTMFFLTPDPNPRQNPAGVTPFDIVTSLLFFVGLIYIFRKQLWLGGTIFFLILSVLLTEIITLERIPEFHYYGLGHPNTLRISLIVPLVIFSVMWAVKKLSEKISNKRLRMWIICCVVCLIAGINFNEYFNQQLTPWIYTTNFVVPIKIVTILNTQKLKDVGLSASFYDSQHIRYFLDPAIHIYKISSPLDCSFKSLYHAVSFLSAQDVALCPQDKINNLLQNTNFTIYPMMNPWNTADVLVLVKK